MPRANYMSWLKYSGLFVVAASVIASAATSMYRLSILEEESKTQRAAIATIEKELARVTWEIGY
jgi:hypothetical protein